MVSYQLDGSMDAQPDSHAYSAACVVGPTCCPACAHPVPCSAPNPQATIISTSASPSSRSSPARHYPPTSSCRWGPSTLHGLGHITCSTLHDSRHSMLGIVPVANGALAAAGSDRTALMRAVLLVVAAGWHHPRSHCQVAGAAWGEGDPRPCAVSSGGVRQQGCRPLEGQGDARVGGSVGGVLSCGLSIFLVGCHRRLLRPHVVAPPAALHPVALPRHLPNCLLLLAALPLTALLLAATLPLLACAVT